MLIKCPECELQVSDKAITCPHCGYPFKKKKENIIYKEVSTKRKRLPNGFGQISKIKTGNLRFRYRAMVTVGKDKNGRPICKLLKPRSYFKTYNDAYQALVEYNKVPIDLMSNGITMDELYHLWAESKINDLKSKMSMCNYSSAWKYASSIYGVKVTQVRIAHLKNCLNDAYIVKKGEKVKASPIIKKYLKLIFNMMFDYAVENEMVSTNVARKFDLDRQITNEITDNTKHHISFTDDEMKALWDNYTTLKCGDMVIVQCYMGWRPAEMLNIKLADVDFDKRIIIGGMKTKNGINRIVPIHSKIYDFIKKRYDAARKDNSKYLFYFLKDDSPVPITPHQYRWSFHKIIDVLNLSSSHNPHDCRKQFITMAKKYNVDEYAIKRIVGHSIRDITEKVYTDRDIEWLKEEIEKIRC